MNLLTYAKKLFTYQPINTDQNLGHYTHFSMPNFIHYKSEMKKARVLLTDIYLKIKYLNPSY